MGDLKDDTPIQYVKGVGPARADQLERLGVKTILDLLEYFPRRFDLRKQAQPMETLRGNEDTATVAGQVVSASVARTRRTPYFECTLQDETGFVAVKWFHGGYLQRIIKEGIFIAVSGKTDLYREVVQFTNPRFQVIWDPDGTNIHEDELLAVYPAGGGLASNVIAKIVRNVLPYAGEFIEEWFDREYLSDRGMPCRSAAVIAMHKPQDKDHWKRARRRLAYDECFLMQLGIAIMRMREVSRPAHPLKLTPQIDSRIRKRFPFTLTESQDRVITEISADLARERPMNRLLQGDVGSGKTVVALHSALLCVAKKFQCAIMAPTEILATQHFDKIQDYLSGSKVRTELLTGGMKEGKRQDILARLSSGEIDILVGTHAILGEKVHFQHLALVVVDEQHKFGVRQRTSIRGKGFAPHYLVMTATPIPRTLAMTVFGDLDVSVIKDAPPGRGVTRTLCLGMDQMPRALKIVSEKLSAGQQAYFIYPLVSPSAQSDLTAAVDAFEDISQSPMGEFGVGLIHGQMPTQQKDEAMRDFRNGKTKILVASVVVEVGVDIPAANVMVIMHAERFGLAQLHQLRGRIGRAGSDAACVLVATPGNPLAQRRLEVLTETSDGFKIAEEDLRIRGPGEFFGTKQHGLPELKVANLIEDFELLRLARRDAFAIVANDPGLNAPHHQILRQKMLDAYAGKLDLLAGA